MESKILLHHTEISTVSLLVPGMNTWLPGYPFFITHYPGELWASCVISMKKLQKLSKITNKP